MNGHTAAVDVALSEWGRCMRNGDDVLGWAKVSVLEKMRRERDGASQSTAPVDIPEGVMATDAAVAKLGDIRQKVLRIAYIRCPDAPRDVQRRYLRMSLHRWNRLLREGRHHVAGCLGIPLSD